MKDRKILVISEDPALINTLEENFPGSGYQVIYTEQAGDGLKKVLELLNPDLIIVDIVMPRMEGVELCLLIRQWCSAPILMLTAWRARSDSIRKLDLSRESCLSEPFSFPELIKRIERALS